MAKLPMWPMLFISATVIFNAALLGAVGVGLSMLGLLSATACLGWCAAIYATEATK